MKIVSEFDGPREPAESAAPRSSAAPTRSAAPTVSAASTLLVGLLVSILVACSAGGSSGASGGPGGSGGPGPSGGPGATGTLTTGELRLRLIDQLGPRWYCDPDSYPIARGDEQSNAIARFAEMQAEAVTFAAIVARLGLAGTTTFTDAQKLAIYQLWKVAISIPLDPIGSGSYRFDYLAQPKAGASEGTRTAGTISDTGEMKVEQQAPAGEPNCPICLARGTLIDTPDGPVAVDRLALGDPVWTIDHAGQRVAGTVIALGSTPAPLGHRVVRLTLADGRSITASPGHPLADGRQLGEVHEGDVVDGSLVTGAELVPYAGGETFDLVASGDTGAYFAGGIPVGSTLLPKGNTLLPKG
jgi:hypothetical protein